MQDGPGKQKNIQPMGNRKEPHPKNWKQTRTIRSNNESKFIIKVSNEKKSKILPTITPLDSPQFQERVKVEIVACDKINQRHGLIYIHDYNIPDMEEYGDELKKEYNLLDVKKATWLTTKNISFTLLLLTFKEKETPIFIEIPGEQAKTEVFEYFERPMSCKHVLNVDTQEKDAMKR